MPSFMFYLKIYLIVVSTGFDLMDLEKVSKPQRPQSDRIYRIYRICNPDGVIFL